MAFQGPGNSPYDQQVLTELRKIREAVELIGAALGHLIPRLTGEVDPPRREPRSARTSTSTGGRAGWANDTSR